MLSIMPIEQSSAFDYIKKYHRHLGAPAGAKFCVSAVNGEGVIVGVATCGRPSSRMLQDGVTAEVTRCATDGTKNACSMLYRSCIRAWRAMGGRRLYTYTLPHEGGASLRAAGFILDSDRAGGGQWSRAKRSRAPALLPGIKLRWIWSRST